MQQTLRRVELLGITSAEPSTYGLSDLASFLGADEETIKKDLKELRSLGISIHLVRGKGVMVEGTPDPEVLQDLLLQYLAFSGTDIKMDRSLTEFLRRQGTKGVGMLVILQRSLQDREMVRFSYRGSREDSRRDHVVGPLLLFNRDKMWRLLALEGGNPRQFHLGKISSLERTYKSFTPPSPSFIKELFATSWDAWVGKDRLPVRLEVSQYWADRLTNRPAVEDQVITPAKEGKFVFTGTVNSFQELSRWIVARGGEVTVLEPESLRNAVVRLAQATLAAHGQ